MKFENRMKGWLKFLSLCFTVDHAVDSTRVFLSYRPVVTFINIMYTDESNTISKHGSVPR